jgi:hypothetical protein
MAGIMIGSVYYWRLSPDDATQRVQIRQLSRDGRQATVVGEMNGVWMKHGWRTSIGKLKDIERGHP